MSRQTITLNGESYVVVPRDEFETLETLAGMPEFPPPRPDGNFSAADYMRVSIARDIIRERVHLGLSQAELARRAGLRVETLCRIESGKVTPSVGSIDKLDRALQQAEQDATKRTPARHGSKRGKR